MELKLFDSKSVSVSDVDLVGRPCSSMLSNSRGGRIFPWFCSYRGKFFTGTVVLIWGMFGSAENGEKERKSNLGY